MFNNQSIYINDLQSDYVKAGAQTNSAHIRELSNFAVQPTNLFVGYAWEEHYTAINRANVVIDKVTDAGWLDEQSKQNYINEARFLRALMYFNLVRFSIEHDRSVNGNITGHCTFATNWSNSEPVLLATSDRYYEQTDPNDQRRDGSWAKRLFNPNTGTDFIFDIPRFRKYIDSLNYANPASSGNAAGQSTNTTVIRYAEVLLIKAEAENELNGPTDAAYDAINQVRRRAYWSPYLIVQRTPSDGSALELSGLSQEQFRERLREERRLEFVLEGHRWFDLKRWHILVKYVKEHTPSNEEVTGTKTTKAQNVSKKNYYLPLPQDQIILNPKLEQNWGYSGETGDGPYDSTFQ